MNPHDGQSMKDISGQGDFAVPHLPMGVNDQVKANSGTRMFTYDLNISILLVHIFEINKFEYAAFSLFLPEWNGIEVKNGNFENKKDFSIAQNYAGPSSQSSAGPSGYHFMPRSLPGEPSIEAVK